MLSLVLLLIFIFASLFFLAIKAKKEGTARNIVQRILFVLRVLAPGIAGFAAVWMVMIIELALLFILGGSGRASGGAMSAASSMYALFVNCIALIVGSLWVWWCFPNRQVDPKKIVLSLVGTALIIPLVLTVYLLLLAGPHIMKTLISLSPIWIIAAILSILLWGAFRLSENKKKEEKTIRQDNFQPISPTVSPQKEETIGEQSIPGTARSRFGKSLFVVVGLAFALSGMFFVVAYKVFDAYAGKYTGGGWLNFQGITELIILSGVQILVSTVYFIVTIMLSKNILVQDGRRNGSQMAATVMLSLFGVGVNLIIDIVVTLSLGVKYGLWGG
ncbi:MAG: hypothetical protein JW976_00260, partial [Syntrophaceae bacterium]|nr:hypothetical protein [Syntrophaceae bacterium]